MSLVQRVLLMMMLCTALPCVKYVVGNQRICMQLEAVDTGIPQGAQRIRQGKMGPRGATGPQGIPGTVDYERLKVMIRDAVIAETAGMKSTVSTLQTSIQTLKSENENMKESIQASNETNNNKLTCGADEFKYNDNCYWTEIHLTRDVTFTAAESICKKRRSTPAYPLEAAHYDIIENTIRQNLPSGTSFQVISLGVHQNPSTGDVTLSDDKAAPYVKWAATQPTRQSSQTHVVIIVHKDSGHAYNGMWDAPPTEAHHGVICQRESL